MKYLLAILLILLIQNISSICEDNQIDINTATLEELDKLTGIGPVKAQAIIDERDFDNLDDLINVYGIGEKTLEKIINQDLACVEDEEENKEEKEKSKESDIKNYLEEPSVEELVEEPSKEERPLEIIKLNAKDIKTETPQENKEEPNKNNYAIYSLIVFSLILGLLFYIKSRRYRKNEFN